MLDKARKRCGQKRTLQQTGLDTFIRKVNGLPPPPVFRVTEVKRSKLGDEDLETGEWKLLSVQTNEIEKTGISYTP